MASQATRGHGRADECAGLENQRRQNARRFESFCPRTSSNARSSLNLLKIIKILETFAFRFCTLWVTSRLEEEVQAA
jgi:hypothetical protein